MDKSLRTLAFLERFPMHAGPTPPLTPQTMLDACIQNWFSSFNFGWVAGGTTARKCRNGCTVLRGSREMTGKYKYCSTVPRTFVQDCSSFLPFIFLFRLSSSSLIAVISSSRSRRNWKKHQNNKTRHPSLLRRNFTKQRRRGQRQKAISLVSKTTTLHMHHAFLYIVFAVPARLRREVTKF